MKSHPILIILICLIISSCIKDTELFIEDTIETKSECSIIGFVNDEAGLPIQNARITFSNQERLSDENGVYYFEKVGLGNIHNYLIIEKEGYFRASRVFRTPHEAEIRLENTLLTQDFKYEFEATQGGIVQANDIRIEFQPNSIIYESTGDAYSGKVRVAIKNIPPNDPQSLKKAPGDFSGLSNSKQISTLKSFGMAGVQLMSTNGEALNISENNTAELEIKVSEEQLSTSPSTLSAWHFDEEVGYWMEENAATLNGNSYTAEVNHFSYWSYMLADPAVILSGKIVNENDNPLTDMPIIVNKSGEDWAAIGFTNIDGTFSGLVPKNYELELQIFGDTLDCQNGQLLATYIIDPLTFDTTLPDFALELPMITMFTITGTVEDCDAQNVKTGYAIIKVPGFDTYFTPITNGQFTATNLICGTQTYELILVDLETGQQSQTYTGSTDNLVDVETVSACGQDISYMTINIPEFGVDNFIFLKSDEGSIFAGYSSYSDNKVISSYYENATTSEHLWMDFGWIDSADTTILQTGSHNIDVFNIAVDWKGLFTNGPYTVNTGTINILSGGIIGSGSYVKGNYLIEANHVPDNQTINISGSFYIKL